MNHNNNISITTCEHQTDMDVIKIIDLIHQKNMFEKCLKETLEELNKTNPALEPGKYHMFCIYTSRYKCFIENIEHKILWYEWKNLQKQIKKNTDVWYSSWNLISYFQHEYTYGKSIEKNVIDKKRD